MSTLSELLAEHTRLSGDAVEHLQRVVAEWQLLADMSFADFLLWVPLEPGGTPPSASASRRPVRPPPRPRIPRTSSAARVTAAENPQLRRAVAEGRICREEDPRWHLEVPVRRETIPVRHGSAGRRGAVPRHEPRHAAGAQPAGDRLPRQRVGPLPDDRRRHLPAARVGRRSGHQPARRRRADPARRARPRRLREPERALGLSPHGARQRPRRAARSPTRRAAGAATPSTPRRSPARIESALDGRHSLRMEVRARGR